MGTAREESNQYDGGLGAGGKFRKRPFRRTSQATPYDRPPTALRNLSGTGDRSGWLSKLVDPTQRLITSSARWLFGSVFRKRLPPPPPHPLQALELEINQEARENPPEATSTDSPVVLRVVMGCENPGNHTDEGGVAELEEILKQKTFTRSEIDHLTSLLRSRTVDTLGGNEEKRFELKSVLSHDKKEEFPKTPVKENETENHLISTPVVSSTVLDEDIASPAELAKAYMGSRPSKASVSMLGLRNQVPRGDLASLNNKMVPSKSTTMALVPRSSGHVGSLGNDFVTPRLQGRSAIYSMTRTPYSRVSSAAVLKGASTASDAFGGPLSSSQSAWEQNRISGSSQGVLKRRSSVLRNDIGSVGPIRRIRQKSNYISSKTLSLPGSAGPLSAHIAGSSSAGVDTLAENGDNSTPGTSFTPVPSKSSEMASKILRQLDKLVSPVDKSPTKLSSSMLHGQAPKSLENVHSSKFLENMHDCDKLSGSQTALPDAQDSMSHKCDKVKENGSTTLVALPYKSVTAVNGVVTNSLMKDNNVPSVKNADSTVIKSVLQLPQQKREAFQMSVHEDYLDDGDNPNEAAAVTSGEGRERLDNCVMGSKSSAPEAILVEKPSTVSEVKPISSSAFNQKPDLRTSDGSTVVEKNSGITFPVAKMATSSEQAAFLLSQSTSTANKDVVSKELNAPSPMLNFGEKVVPSKQSDVAASAFGFASTNVGEASSVNGSSGVKLAPSSDQKLENSSSFATTAAGTTNYLSDKTGKEKTLNGIIFKTTETAIPATVSTLTSAGSIFKFGASASSSTLNNGSLGSSSFSFSSPMPSPVTNNGQSSFSSSTNYMPFTTNSGSSAAATTSTTANATISSTSGPSIEASVPSFTDAPVFKFTASVNPSASVSMLSATSGEATEAKTQDTSLGNVAIVPFGSTSAQTSSGSNIFGSTSAHTSSGSNIFGSTSKVTGIVSSVSGFTTAAVTGSGNVSGASSTNTNSGSGFLSSTFSSVTSAGDGIFGSTSANAGSGSSVLGGTSATTGTGSSVFGGKSAATGTGSSVFGGTSFSIASTGSSIFSPRSAITSTGSHIFGLSSAAASTFTTQTQGLNPFNAVNTQASAVGSGSGASTQSIPVQISSSESSPFGLAGNTNFSTGSSVFGLSPSVAKPFGSGPTFGMSSSSSETNSLTSSNGIASGTFGSNMQAPKAPIVGPSSVFSFGSSASVTTSSAATIFASATGASSSSIFSFTSAAAVTPSRHVFGSTGPGLVFGSTTPSGNNDQMEDSMAEDTIQASPTVTTFGQQPVSSPASGFVFGASNTLGASSFQLEGQPSTATPQNPSPFQASGIQEFGGSFSLGTGGDKSGRKFVKVRRQRKK